MPANPRCNTSLVILATLIFSKYFYMASLGSYYTFYLIHKFGVSVQSAQVHLFVFLGAVAAGTIIRGPVGDRIGRRAVIWASILGVLPFTLALPYASLFWTGVLVVPIGLILASAFSAILVYAQELMPGRVGLISGLFFGFAFGMGGIGAALLGAKLHDVESSKESGADGLALDAHDRIYVTSSSGVQVFDRKGLYLGTIRVPRQPSNVAFAGPGKQTLYITAREGLYRISTLTSGPNRLGK